MTDIPDEHPIRAFVVETGNLKDGFQKACERIAVLEQWLGVVLYQVDYTNGACGPAEAVAAVLPIEVIEQAREVLVTFTSEEKPDGRV